MLSNKGQVDVLFLSKGMLNANGFIAPQIFIGQKAKKVSLSDVHQNIMTPNAESQNYLSKALETPVE